MGKYLLLISVGLSKVADERSSRANSGSSVGSGVGSLTSGDSVAAGAGIVGSSDWDVAGTAGPHAEDAMNKSSVSTKEIF
jgi:hypothetical protein